MILLLSPTKKMRSDPDSLPPLALPAFLENSRTILDTLRSLSPDQLRRLWGCSDAIAEQNLRRLREMDLETGLTPAILSYEGIAFQYMAPSVFTDAEFAYVQEHLRILSGFYGVLRPMDGVRPYRLEMQAKLSVSGSRDLYDFWGRRLCDSLRTQDRVFVDLASREYSGAVVPYLTPEDTLIRCTFMEEVGGKAVQKATFAKMARGEMVRYLASIQADSPRQMQGFRRLGFHFRDDLSTQNEYVFQRIPENP